MVMTLEEKKASKRLTNTKYYLANKEKIAAYAAKWATANKDKINAASKRYMTCKENKENKAKWMANNRDKVNASFSKYRLNNKDKVNALGANRRAKKFGATIYMTKEDKAKIVELYTIAQDATKLFGYAWVVDHIVPLARGGLHKLSNLQVVPGSWNAAKSDRNCDTYWD